MSPIGPISLTGCTVSKNHADTASGLGGGIFIGIGETILSGCTVTENTALGAGGGGGGIAMYGEGNLNLDITLISGNKATVTGGGIYNGGGMVGLDDGKNVTGNTPDNCSGQLAGCQN
jgi:predicted outer membrane repeat protein